MKKVWTVGRKNKVQFLIDKQDYELTTPHRWYLQSKRKDSKTQYIYTFINGKIVYLHRFLMQPSNGLFVDHINRNGIDNRRKNLRICTHSSNCRNKPSIGGTSKYLGVYWHKYAKKWNSKCLFNGKKAELGYYDCEIEAAKAYDKFVKDNLDEFAYTNFPYTS